MSEPMSRSTDWVQFYQHHNLTGQGVPPGPALGSSNMISPLSDATVVATNTTASAAAAGNLIPEGRVSKPTRRRRASRAAPTTLLNTDTTNFRAMVQQFTGIPNAPFAFGSHSSAGNLHFGNIGGHQNATTPSLMPHGYYNQPNHQRQQQQQQQQQYMFSLNPSNDGFVSGFNNNPRPDLGVSDSLFMDNISSQVFPRSSSSNDNRSNGYGM